MREVNDQGTVRPSQGEVSYPLDAFPVLVREAILEVHAYSNIPVEVLGAAALGAISLACQGATDVRVQANGQPFPCSLFLLTVAEPFSGKSYATSVFTAGIKRFEKLKDSEAQEDAMTFSGRLATWNVMEKKLTKELSRAEQGTPEFEEIRTRLIEHHVNKPKKLNPKGLFLTKATSAGIREELLKNDGRIGILAPDAGNAINGPTFGDMPFLSGLWSGEDVRDGLASGSPPLKDPRLTLALTVQDSELERFLKKRGRDAIGNGLLSRFLIMRAPSVETTQKNPSDEKVSLLNDRMFKILTRAALCSSGREVLGFSDQAKRYWGEYHDKIIRLIKENGWGNGKQYFARRLTENLVRIAALFHRISGMESDEISLDFAYGASRLCDWYLSKFDEAVLSKEQLDAKKIVDWIKKYHQKQYAETTCRFKSTVYSFQTLQQFGPVRNSADLKMVMQVLMANGDVSLDKIGPKGGGNYDFAPVLRQRASSNVVRSYHSAVRATSLGWEDLPAKSDDFL